MSKEDVIRIIRAESNERLEKERHFVFIMSNGTHINTTMDVATKIVKKFKINIKGVTK